MATKIIHKKSSVASRIPAAADLEPGELALNLADQKIYSKTTAGTIIEMAPQGSGAAASTITETCKNVSGGSLAIGTPVYASGTAGNSIEVQAARADTAGAMPAIGILAGTLADEAEGILVLTGFIQGVNTSSFSEGDTLYVAATGGLTATPPAGSGNLIQNIGKVVKVHLNNGSIMVTGAGRANATPNLDDGDIFIGNSSNQATTASLTTEVQNIGDSRYVNVTGDSMTGNLSFGDNDKAIFGAGSDLQIYHSGSQSFVQENGTGQLVLDTQNGARVKLTANNGTENMVVANKDGDVELYYDNALKLATTSTGIDVTGDATFADNGKAIFGAGSDLQIYHDGSHSRISDQGTGNLIINAGEFRVNTANDAEAIIKGNTSGDVELYYSGVAKLATTSTGVDITGTLTSDGLTVDGDVTLGNGSTLYIDDQDSIVFGTYSGGSSGTLLQGGTSTDYSVRVAGKLRQNISTGGDISFYEDTGTTAKFFWDASAESLGIGTSSVTSGFKLDVVGDARFSDVAGDDGVELGWSAGGSAGFVQAYDRGASAFRDLKLNNAVTIDSSGNLLVGKTSAGIANAGTQIEAAGAVAVTRDGSVPLYLNRQTSDGDIAVFRKDGTTVGSIGSASGYMVIGSPVGSDAHLLIGNNLVHPATSTGSAKDDSIDIGGNSNRFKDLHLSGTVNANSVDLGSFVVTETNGHLYFSVNGVNKMKLDSSGNLQVVGNVDSNATIT